MIDETPPPLPLLARHGLGRTRRRRSPPRPHPPNRADDLALAQQATALESGDKAIGATTILRLCDGTYNAGAGVSVRLLWRVCLEIESGDAHCARMLAAAYLVALGLVPHSGEASLASEFSILNAHIHHVALAMEKHNRQAEAKAKRDAKRNERKAVIAMAKDARS